MHPLVLALFDDPASAAKAARGLRSVGLARERVSVVARSHDEEGALAEAAGASPGSEIEDSRPASQLGELSAHLLAAIALVLPGVGPIVAAVRGSWRLAWPPGRRPGGGGRSRGRRYRAGAPPGRTRAPGGRPVAGADRTGGDSGRRPRRAGRSRRGARHLCQHRRRLGGGGNLERLIPSNTSRDVPSAGAVQVSKDQTRKLRLHLVTPNRLGDNEFETVIQRT